MCLFGTLVMLIPAGTASAQSSAVALPPLSQGSCAGQVPIVVGSDAAAQSDIYAAAMLAGVIGSDCIVLAGPRGESMPADQQARLQAANAGGFVVGGEAAVPDVKIAGRTMARLFGPDRWATARRVGQHAAGVTPDASATQGVPPKIDGVAVPPQSQGSCAGEVPIVVGSDAAAQSDIYAAAMLAGVIGSDCIVLAGPRGESMPAEQQARLAAASAGGFVVGGIAAVPTAKIAGRSMTRLSGNDRWETARLVGRRAAGDTTAGTSTNQEAIEAVFARAAAQRAEIVAGLTKQIRAGNYGVDDDNVLRGPAGFRIDLNACPDAWSDTTGITDSQVRIGHTTAQSGNRAAFGNITYGLQNYFDWINENDPIMVGGSPRELTLIIRDDGYVAAQTTKFVDELIEVRNVFSILTLGSPNALAVYDKINEECVPHPFVMSGHPAWGDPVVHPWTTIMQLSYSTESILWGTWIEQNLANKLPVRVAAVVMDNDFGLAYEQAFEEWADAHPEVVSSFTAVRHDPEAPSLAREMQAVVNANPDVYISMTAGNSCLLAIQAARSNGLTASIRAKGGALFTPSVCKGIEAYMKPAGEAADGWWIIGGGSKDSTDPKFIDEPFIAFANSNLEAAGLDPAVSLYATGYTYGYPYGEALRIAAELPGGLNRTNFILAVRAIDIYHPMILDGIITQFNGNADAYFVEGSDFSQFDATAQSWNQVSDVVDVNGQTPNCVWVHNHLQDAVSRCGTATRERLTSLAVRGPADVNDTFWAGAYAHRVDQDSSEDRLKPGYWQVTADSLCLHYDHADEEWRQGSQRGAGWIGINEASVEVNQSTRIRVEHGDWVEVTTWSGGNRGATTCELNWVADLD